MSQEPTSKANKTRQINQGLAKSRRSLLLSAACLAGVAGASGFIFWRLKDLGDLSQNKTDQLGLDIGNKLLGLIELAEDLADQKDIEQARIGSWPSDQNTQLNRLMTDGATLDDVQPVTRPVLQSLGASNPDQNLLSKELDTRLNQPNNLRMTGVNDQLDLFRLQELLADIDADLRTPNDRSDAPSLLTALDQEKAELLASLEQPQPFAPTKPLAAPKVKTNLPRLKLFNVHNHEQIDVTRLGPDGSLESQAKADLQKFMRDWRNNQTHQIDSALYGQLIKLACNWAQGAEIQVISAYRSPTTNALLARKSSGVAKRSYHTRGMAIDFRIEGKSLKETYHQALRLNAGGVGYYPSSNFIHIDTGPVRNWPSRYNGQAKVIRKQAFRA